MKLNRYIFITISVALLVLISISFYSCEYFIKSENAETTRISKSNETITTQQSEAKLLVLASKHNLDVIELCTIIEEEKIDKDVKNLVEEIKKEHLVILEKYNKLASENVISIPRYSNLNYEEILKLNDSLDLEVHLKLLSTKIYSQKDLLDKLSDTTNNSAFKALVQSANSTLIESIDKTKKSLEILDTDS